MNIIQLLNVIYFSYSFVSFSVLIKKKKGKIFSQITNINPVSAFRNHFDFFDSDSYSESLSKKSKWLRNHRVPIIVYWNAKKVYYTTLKKIMDQLDSKNL